MTTAGVFIFGAAKVLSTRRCAYILKIYSGQYMSGPIDWFEHVVVSSTNSPGWGRMLPWHNEGDNLITYTEPWEQPSPPGGPIIKVARSVPPYDDVVLDGDRLYSLTDRVYSRAITDGTASG
ncbi:MAG: hypothetical protein WA364_00555 [Candidatus Nitrosopolaris sp.]